MEKTEKNPKAQPTQGPLLSLQRRPYVSDEAGRRSQWMERTRIFAGPRDPSPSRTSSLSCSSLESIKLPPVHLGQPKVVPRNLQSLTVPEVQLRQPVTVPVSEEEADALIRMRLRMIDIAEKMEKMEKRNAQATQGPLLSLRRRPRAVEEEGRGGQRMEKTRSFALPREQSPSHTSSSSCSSLGPTKLPPVHLGQPKVGPRNLQSLKVPEVQLRQPQAAPQGSRSQALSHCGDRLPPLPPVTRRPPLPPVTRLPALLCLLSPRDTESRGTELGSAGEKGPQPCSPCAWQPHSPVPRVLLPPLRVAREGTARVSPSWQLLPVPPIRAGAAAVERSLRGTGPEKQNDSKCSQEEPGSDQELSQVIEDVELFQEDSESEQELSLVEDDSELSPEDSTSEEPLSQVEEAIELSPGDSDTEAELSEEEEAGKVTSGDSTNEEELSPVEEASEVSPEHTTSGKELTPVEDYSELFPVDSTSEEKLPDVEEDIKVTSGGSTSDEELSPGEEAISSISGDNLTDEELSPVQEHIEVIPEGSRSEKDLSSEEENHEEEPSQGESNCDEELPQGDYYKNEKLSPVHIKHETELSIGQEDSDVQGTSPWEADDSEQLSLWEECEQEELTRRTLLGGNDTDSSSSPELPDLEEMSGHQKVLEWLEPNCLNDYDAEEEEEETETRILQKLSKRKRLQEKLEAERKELSGTEVAAEAASALPSASRAPWSPTDTELAAATPSRATEEEEEPPQALALQDTKAAAAAVLSEDGTSLGTRSSREPLRQAVPELQALRQQQQQQQQQQDALEHWRAAGRAAAAPPEREGSSVAAPHSPPRPWPAQPGAQALRGQPAAPSKRPSRFRRALRALRGLFRWPCLGPRPEP